MRHHASRRGKKREGGELPETPLRGMEIGKAERMCFVHTHSFLLLLNLQHVARCLRHIKKLEATDCRTPYLTLDICAVRVV